MTVDDTPSSANSLSDPFLPLIFWDIILNRPVLRWLRTDPTQRWQEIIPFAERLATRELRMNWQEWLQEFVTLTQVIYRLPKSIDAVISQVQQGNLTVKNSFAPERRQLLVRPERSIKKLSWAIGSVGLLIAGVTVKKKSYRELAVDHARSTGDILF